jgi:hypothetical protein
MRRPTGVTRLRRRERSADDGGFVLLESIIAMGLITVIMGGLVTMLTATVQTTNHLRIRQEAIQLADTQVEKIRAHAPTALRTGRDPKSVGDQYNAGTAPTAPPELSGMLNTIATVSDPDPLLAPDAGATTVGAPAVPPAVCPSSTPSPPLAFLPTSPQCTAVGTRPFWVSTYLGCDSPSSGTPCDVSLPLRAIVAVTWNSPCNDSRCVYVTSTLIDAHDDPKFDIVQPGPGTALIDVTDLVNDVGDAISSPFLGGPTTRPGVGMAPFTWSATGLPPGLTMAADGTISGTIADQAVGSKAYTVTVTVVDGLIQRNTASFTWTVRRPTIVTPAPAPTPINAPMTPLPVVAVCWKAPCVYTMTNGPTGLTINSSTGVITGTPTVVGTARDVTVSITDGNSVVATSDLFDWVIVPPPSSVCVPEIALTNGSFEDPGTPAVLDGAPNWMTGGSLPLKWDTTEQDNVIELWRNDNAPGPGTGLTAQAANGGLPISAQDGYQWAELNANQTGALFQNLPTNPGVVLQWSVWHRGRYSGALNAAKKDVMRVQIGSTTPGTQLDQPATNVATGVTATDISDDSTAWHLYRGFYIVPPGQTTTRFQFAAISTASGDNSIGNFIDNLSLNNQVACVEKLPDPQTSTLLTPIAPLQLTAIRGSGNYQWSGGGTLPAGLGISTSGLVTGTPLAVGVSSVKLILTDTQTNFTTNVPFTWTIVAKPTVTAPSNQTTSAGGTVKLQLTTTCLNKPCAYTMANGPAGLTVSSLGLISGRITSSAQTFSTVKITVVDADGATATSTAFVWTVLGDLTVTSPGDQKTLRGAAVSLDMAPRASGGVPFPGSPRYTFSASGLPSWLSMDRLGVISGVAPSSAESTTPGITATTAAFSWIVYSAPTVTAPADQASNVGATVNVPVASTCGNAPCTFSISGQPSGLGISNAGVINGTVTGTPQTYGNVRVVITDAAGASTRSTGFTWTISWPPPSITPVNQTTTIGSTNTNYTPASTCANAPCTYTMTGAPLALSINATTGAITGTVSGTTQTNVVVTIKDAGNTSVASAPFTWTVKAPPTITPVNQTTTVGSTNTNYAPASTCPNTPCTYTMTGAPTGLSINVTTGAVTGTVGGAPQTYSNVVVTIKDAANISVASTPFTWTVKAAPTITTPAAQTTTVGTTITPLSVTTTCANTPCVITMTGAPGGLTINAATGVISGTVTGAAQIYNVVVTIKDAANVSASSASFAWTVKAAPTITPVNQTTTIGSTNTNYTPASTCPNSPCTYTMTGAPTALTINITTGAITGNVIGTTQTNVVVTIKDAANISVASAPFTWTVKAAPTITPVNQSTTIGSTNTNYTPASTCPNTPCTYTMTGAPTALTIDVNTGAITGTVSGTTQTNVVVTITDAANISASSAPFTWTVHAAPTMGSPGNQTVRGGTAASLNVSGQAASGTAPYTYSATGLPAWLTINSSTGVISGTAPTARSLTSGITVSATDSAGVVATSSSFQWFVSYPSIAIADEVSKTGVAASIDLDNYSTGGVAPYTYVITNKPAWLTYNTTSHVLSGTTFSSGTTFNVTVTATDAAGSAVTAPAFDWRVIGGSTLVWSTVAAKSSLPNVAITAVNVTGSVSNELANSFTAVGLPPGLVISAAGVISGTPTVPGTYRVAVSAMDSAGVSTPSAPFTWIVTDLAWATIPPQSSVHGFADSLDVTAFDSGGYAPLTYTASNLPVGLTINATTGIISGTPTTVLATRAVTITVTDTTGASRASASFNWAVT